MVEQFNRKAGEYTLDYIRIYKFNEPSQFIEISALVHEWSLTESINSGYINGQMKVYDAVGLLDYFVDGKPDGWLRGEEEIEISYTDFFGTTLKEKYFVYSITDLQSAKRGNETIYEYNLHFVSKEKFLSDRFFVRRSFSGDTISNYVQEVFDTYFFSDKDIFIEETAGNQTLVVPNYKPEEAMNFFARKAYSGEYMTQTWRFFENREGFYFKTHEGLIEDHLFNNDQQDGEEISQLPTFVRDELPDQTPEGQVKLMSTLLDVQYPVHINTFEDLHAGAYYNKVTELDFLNRSTIPNEYHYLDQYGQYLYPDGQQRTRSKHSKQFIDEHFIEPKEVLVLKDYSEDAVAPYLRRNTHYPEMYNEKNINHYHHQNEMVTLKIRGRNTINAGDLIVLKLKDVNYAVEDREEDLGRSGYYIVESATSVFFENTYHQVLQISKSGYQGQQEAPDLAVRQSDSTATETGSSNGSEEVNKPHEAGGKGKADEVTRFEAGSQEGKAAAEEYLGRPMTDKEYNELVAATFAESGRDPREEAYIAGTILNRARSTDQTVTEVLNQPGQFTAVTGTSHNPRPSRNYVNGPPRDLERSINGSLANNLSSVPKNNYYFNSASRAAVQKGERYVASRYGVKGQLVGESFVYPGARWP